MTATEIKNEVDFANTILFVSVIPVFFILLNAAIVYYYLKPLQIFSKRHPNSVVLLSILCLINTIMSGIILPMFKQSKCCADPWKNWLAVWTLIGTPVGPGVFYTTMYRIYICFYDIGFNEALIDDQWRSHIDSTATQQNWFVKHRKTLGSRKWAQWYCFGMLGVFTILITVAALDFMPTILMRSIVSLSAIVPFAHICILSVLLWLKLPDYSDAIGLRREVKNVCIVYLIGLTYYMGYIFIVQPAGNSIAFTILSANYVVLTFSFVVVQTYFVFYEFGLPMNIISLRRSPMYKHIMKNATRKANSNNRPSIRHMASISGSGFSMGSGGDIGMDIALPRVSSNRPLDTSGTTSPTQLQSIKISHVVSSESGVRLFCRHLCKEFCLENMLFLMETQQLFDSIGDTTFDMGSDEPISPIDTKSDDGKAVSFPLRDTVTDKRDSKSVTQRESKATLSAAMVTLVTATPKIGKLKIEFHSSMPKSEIVFNPIHSRLKQFCAIFEKYIRMDGMFCVNLSSRVRHSMFNLFHFNGRAYFIVDDAGDDIGTTDSAETALKGEFEMSLFVSHFGKARREVYNLLRESFARFKITPEFREWSSAVSKSEV